MDGPQVGDGVATLSRGDVVLVLWRSPASPERWDWQFRRVTAAAEERNILYVSLILPSSDPPDAKVRRTIGEGFRALGPKLRHAVMVPLGTSMWASIVRTIVRGTFLLSGQARQQSVAGSVADAIDRVRELASDDTPSARELRAMVTELREALGVATDELGAAI